MLCYVTHNSAKRMSLGAKRLGCQRWHTTECLLEAECNEIVFGMCSVERGSMEAKALSFVLQTAGSEHHQFPTMARVYVRSGRAGGSERHLLFFVRYVEILSPGAHQRPVWVGSKKINTIDLSPKRHEGASSLIMTHD